MLGPRLETSTYKPKRFPELEWAPTHPFLPLHRSASHYLDVLDRKLDDECLLGGLRGALHLVLDPFYSRLVPTFLGLFLLGEIGKFLFPPCIGRGADVGVVVGPSQYAQRIGMHVHFDETVTPTPSFPSDSVDTVRLAHGLCLLDARKTRRLGLVFLGLGVLLSHPK